LQLINDPQLLRMRFKLPEGWHCHGRQNGDNRNYHKAFDEGKSGPISKAFHAAQADRRYD
jgi:hypothetical protein